MSDPEPLLFVKTLKSLMTEAKQFTFISFDNKGRPKLKDHLIVLIVKVALAKNCVLNTNEAIPLNCHFSYFISFVNQLYIILRCFLLIKGEYNKV